MGLRLIRALPGAPGFLATITCAMRKHQRKLGISVGMPGPHDFNVREGLAPSPRGEPADAVLDKAGRHRSS
jgi:hypothetical protein